MKGKMGSLLYGHTRRKWSIGTLQQSWEWGQAQNLARRKMEEDLSGNGIMPLCFPTFLCSSQSFRGGPALCNLLWIWDYKNMIILGKVSQMLREQLQNKLLCRMIWFKICPISTQSKAAEMFVASVDSELLQSRISDAGRHFPLLNPS